jgi:hypothetical protein
VRYLAYKKAADMNKFILAFALLSTNLAAHAIGLSFGSLGIGNVFGQLASQSGVQASGESVDQVLQQISTQWNQKMPMEVDPGLRLDRVSAERGRHFTYHYTVVADPTAGKSPVDFSENSRPQLKSQMCSSADNQKFLKNGVTVASRYEDAAGHLIGEAEVTPTDCGFSS